MADETKLPKATPDAIKFKTGWQPLGESFPGVSRVDKLCSYFEKVLGGSRQTRPAYITQLSGGQWNLASLDQHATLKFPTGHEYEKMPMYDWYEQPNGLEFGYFKEAAAPTPANAPAFAAARQAANEQAASDMAAWKEQDAKMQRLRDLRKLGATIGDDLRAERDRLHAELMDTCEMYRCSFEAGQTQKS